MAGKTPIGHGCSIDSTTLSLVVTCGARGVPQRDPTPVIHGFVCQTCGVLSEKRKEVYGGSWAVELLLYILFCVPGFIYTAWRYSARKAYCRACGGTSIIPINTPVGIEIYNRYHRH